MPRTPTLLLASRSPRRAKILRFAGIPFRVQKAERVREIRLKGESPASLVRRLALEKALFVSRRNPKAWVLGADTVVSLGDRIFEKPKNPREAGLMLRALQNRSHVVLTGVAIVGGGGRTIRRGVERTRVSFKHLTAQEIKAYLGTREPYDKAGAYDIQGTAGKWIKNWQGDYFNVMGLPLRWVVHQMGRLGIR